LGSDDADGVGSVVLVSGAPNAVGGVAGWLTAIGEGPGSLEVVIEGLSGADRGRSRGQKTKHMTISNPNRTMGTA
jgi:hypothetical protein